MGTTDMGQNETTTTPGTIETSGTTGDPIRVLYVDDDTTALRTRGGLIEEHDRLEVVTESTVTGGLERLATTGIDCVLSDVEMPDRDGLDFLERVRERDRTFPFVLFGANPSETLVSEALAAGATDFVPKSVCTTSYRLLTHRIVVAVEHHRRRRSAGSLADDE
jgi:CheY-like chemotaxis protein